MRRHAVFFMGLLFTSGCFLTSGGPVPAPVDPVELEARVAANRGDVAAVAALARSWMNEGRVQEAREILIAAMEADPHDPAVPLMVAVADERMGDVRSARDGYERYSSTHFGILARRARQRLSVTALDMLRIEMRELANRPLGDSSTVNPGTVAVLPFDRTVEAQGNAGEADAVAAVIPSSLAQLGWDVVDPHRVRLLVEEMGLSGTSLLELATGLELGRRLRAEHVVQGRMSRVSLDTLEWAVTVTSLREPAGARVDAILLRGGVDEVPLLEQRLSLEVARGLSGPRASSLPTTFPATLNPAALVALGTGLQAMDRGDWQAAVRAFTEAVGLDSQFEEALSLQRLAIPAAEAPPLDALVGEIARVGALQRMVRHLRAVSGSRATDRPVVSDFLGLDALTGGTLIDLTLTVPGGGR